MHSCCVCHEFSIHSCTIIERYSRLTVLKDKSTSALSNRTRSAYCDVCVCDQLLSHPSFLLLRTPKSASLVFPPVTGVSSSRLSEWTVAVVSNRVAISTAISLMRSCNAVLLIFTRSYAHENGRHSRTSFPLHCGSIGISDHVVQVCKCG